MSIYVAARISKIIGDPLYVPKWERECFYMKILSFTDLQNCTETNITEWKG